MNAVSFRKAFEADPPEGRSSGAGTGLEYAAFRHTLDMLLASGGDERIAIDPVTDRNRYGTPRGSAPGETWFASSTASAISPRGYEAAARALRSVLDTRNPRPLSDWFGHIRDRLTGLFGIPGAEVILAASGTETEFIALTLAGTILRQPITSIVLAPKETGSGVVMASQGRHFLQSAPFAAHVPNGQIIGGLETSGCCVELVEIRDSKGAARSAEQVDAEVAARVETILAAGRAALVHVLDCSKTGRTGLQRQTAAALMAKSAGRLLVVVDACQLRCTAEQILADLQAGFMVMITGSKFAGGPPFAGALLLPPTIVAHLKTIRTPGGLAAYSALHDWPSRFHDRLHGSRIASANLGLGLRWEAALAELEALFALDSALRAQMVARFAALVTALVSSTPGLELIDGSLSHDEASSRTIFPIITAGQNGEPIDAAALHRALRTCSFNHPKLANRIFHVGQPVPIGDRAALRICLGAPQMVDMGLQIGAGGDFDTAFAPLAEDLTALIEKWSYLRTDWPARQRERLAS